MQTQTLKLAKTKELIFTAAFVGLAVYTPFLIHYFGGVNIGRTFLPIHFFVLMAGLLLGWRAGLIAGLASPAISYFISGMPLINILPFIIVELSFYGLVAGILREKFNLNILVSLFSALIIGRIALLVSLLLFSDINAFVYAKGALFAGWRGIVLQIIFIPIIVKKLYQYFRNGEL